MTKEKSLRKNFIMNAILTVSSVVFPVITYPYASRILQPAGVGKVSFAYAVVCCFLMFARWGIPTYGLNICAKVRDDREKLSRTVQELLIINLITGTISYAVLFLGVAFVPKMNTDKTLYLTMSAIIFMDIIGVEWMFKALEQYSYITIRSLIFKVVSIVLMFLWVKTRNDYVLYGLLSSYAIYAPGIVNHFCARRHVTMKPLGNYQLKRHFKAVSIFFAMACATYISTHVDTVMLGFLSTDEHVGYYSTAVKFKIILVEAVTSLGAVLLPRASYCVGHGLMEEFRVYCKKAINFVLLLTPAMALYFILFALQSILLMSGSGFLKSVLPMQIIMPTLIFMGLTNILGIQMLVPLGREKVVLRAVLTGAAVNVVLNAMLIPLLQETGAAIGTVVAEVVVFGVQFWALREQLSGIFKEMQYAKILAASLVGVAASFWVANLAIHPFWILVISACLFFGAYGVTLLVLKESLVWELAMQVKEAIAQKTRK